MTAATPPLATARLRLRALRVDDAEAMFPSLSDPDLMTWWSRPPFDTVAEVRDYFGPRPDMEGWRCWAITLAGDDQAIGWVATGEKRQGGVSEIGYLLARAHWGSGIAREAVSAVITQIFAEGKRRIFADTDPENTASNALLERLGFRREGLLRGEWETHIGIRDSVIWGLLATEWKD
ncbi:GNAT family N-acetyltransferase [Hephaestia sp. GCM10023244]|uniref:GNAT family N-acetyltransferase n=1 Tax=unclassified Hephaestia TaxID=2631281 RepID=UPI0020771758|nr:GNAT family N-acetyltransferase [Hephaestia sp. MAHUQ-44]MCM8729510.1 GNAT family N-acetyltransferase [Hephaestia sp. MAHUQ-44]